jgi:hypothetical protein
MLTARPARLRLDGLRRGERSRPTNLLFNDYWCVVVHEIE